MIRIGQTWDGTPIGADEAVDLELGRAGDEIVIRVSAPFHGDPAPEGPAGPTWALWEHEVVELFVLGPDERYTEIELGPHGHHLVLQLHGRRQITARELPLAWTPTIAGERWTGEARLSFNALPPGPHRGNATAIHGVGSARRYLAATAMPGLQPDFHRLERWESLDMARARY